MGNKIYCCSFFGIIGLISVFKLHLPVNMMFNYFLYKRKNKKSYIKGFFKDSVDEFICTGKETSVDL